MRSLLLLFVAALPAAALETMPVSAIRPGMKGHGLTVFSGTTIERFGVTIVGVMKNTFPGQDMILARLHRTKGGFDIAKTGVIGGMSGSPIYLDGKLIGALAYGWAFAREPLCGITPVANMIAAQRRKPARRLGRATPAPGGRAWPWKPGAAPAGMRPLRAPLVVAGATRRTMARLRAQLDGSWLVPLEGGSGAGAAAKRTTLAPGAAMAVSLMQGDLSFSAVGTATYVDDGTVVGFGHPFFGGGDCALPMHAARIDGIVNSSMQSFKLGSPIGTAGTLTADRLPGVVGRLGKAPRTIPIACTLRNAGAQTARTFRCRAIDHPRLTPLLLSMALFNFVDAVEPSDRPHSVEYALTIAIDGRAQPLVYRDRVAGGGAVSTAAWTGVFSLLWSNPWASRAVTGVTLEATITPGDAVATIAGARLVKPTLRAGDTARLVVSLDRKNGPSRTVELALPLPKDLPADTYEIRVVGGDLFDPPVPRPRTLAQLEAQIARIHRGDELVAYITLPRLALQHRGALLERLPKSVVGALLPPGAHGEVGAAPERRHVRQRTDWSIRGRQRVVVTVEESR